MITTARLFISISIATLALATTAVTGCAAPTVDDPLTGTTSALAAKQAADEKCGCDSSKEQDEDGESGSKEAPGKDTGGKVPGNDTGDKVPSKDPGGKVPGGKVPSKEPGKDGADCPDDDGYGYPDKEGSGGKGEDDGAPDNCSDCDEDAPSKK